MAKGVLLHAAIKLQLALSAGPSSTSKKWSFPVADGPESDRKVYLLPFCCLVFVQAPALVLINIKQVGELHGVEILAAAVVLLQFLQFILHHLRFRRSHWLLQWGAWGAYYVPMPLAALAVGEMLRLQRPYWPVAVLFAAGQSDTMAAYSLDDDSHNMRRFAKRTLYLAYLVVALLQLQQGVPTELPYYSLVVAGFIVLLVHLKFSSMAMVPSGDICMVAAEAASSRRCRSAQQGLAAVVAVGSLESRSSAIAGSTTYEDILAMEYSEKLQDVCLSSALCLQLLQRYHSPRQRVAPSIANTAFRKLLVVEDSLRDYARALKLVEVQLSLMYDHFFSAHGSPSSASYKLYWDHWVFKIGFLMHTLSLVYVYPKANLNDLQPQRRQAEAEHGGEFAIGAVYLLVMLELCQLVHYLTSDRFVVSYMCDRARALSQARRTSSGSTCKPLHMVVLNAILLETRDTSWQTTLGQYSLVEDYSDYSCTSLGQRFMGRLHHHGRRPQTGNPASAVPLSMDQVKAWILEKLVIVTPPERGRSVSSASSATASEAGEPSSSPSRRKKYFPRQLSWTFRQETETHTILTWHIATWICSMRTVEEASSDYMAATKLSSYCAYLVAFHPELLPEHNTVVTRIFEKAIREAELHLKGETSPYGRYTRLAEEQGKLPQGVLERASRLARQLKQIEIKHGSSYCWAMIADFWAQMMLHLAQSGNATAHIEHLAKGGEFVTRLWALLSNAGMQQNTTLIIKRKKIDDRKKVHTE